MYSPLVFKCVLCRPAAADVLPFDLEGYGHSTAPPSPAPPSPGCAQAGGFGSPTAAVPPAPDSGSGQAAPAPSPAGPSAAAVPRTGVGAGAGASAGAAASSDAAVGAFVRLLQEAPPLRSFAGGGGGGGAAPRPETPALEAGGGRAPLTLQAGLKQFELIRERLQSRGMVRGAMDL